MLHQMIVALAVGWVLITAMLITLLIYRGVLQTHEEDQLFLDPAERELATQQHAMLMRIEKLNWPVRALFAVSAVIFVTTLGMWLCQGLASF